MKKIEVIFRPEKLEPLKETLLEAGIKGATFYQVSGCGNQHGWIAYHRGSEVMMNTLPKSVYDDGCTRCRSGWDFETD